jgi:carbohydrate kinase (thermoresistant glucokinase family)
MSLTKSISKTHLVIMGVSGCGKTTLGVELASALGWPFYDADDFHPPHNVEKMRKGLPLNDEDRWPWLIELNQLLKSQPNAVLACSALKASYRATLGADLPQLQWIHPHGDFDVIAARIDKRSRETGHYMPASLLTSQFEALELCPSAIMLAIDMTPAERVAFVLGQITN